VADNSKILIPVKNSAPVVYVPQATTEYKGMVQVGDGLDIDAQGILSVDPFIQLELDDHETRLTEAESNIDALETEIDDIQDDIIVLQNNKVDQDLIIYPSATLVGTQEVYINDAGIAKKATLNQLRTFVTKDLTGIGRFDVVTELPLVGESNVVYLLLIDEPDTDNYYEEYIWLTSEEKYELIGTTQIDLIDSNLTNTSTNTEISLSTNQKEVNEHFANYSTMVFNIARTYNENKIVEYAGNFYKSLQNSNTGNLPDVSPTYWEQVGGSVPSERWIDYAEQPSGTGTSVDPYLIYTAEELAWIAKMTNTILNWTTDAPIFPNFKIMNDIDLGGKQWTSIGRNLKGYMFNGKLMSNGGVKPVIRNLIQTKGYEYSGESEVYGLFGSIDTGFSAEAQFPDIIDYFIYAKGSNSIYAGAFCGDFNSFALTGVPNGTSDNHQKFKGTIIVDRADTITTYVGGWIGRTKGSIIYEYLSGDINITILNGGYVGGIIGGNTLISTIRYSSSKGNIYAYNGVDASGIGSSRVNAYYCLSNVNITGTYSRAGAFITTGTGDGNNYVVSNCINLGNIIITGEVSVFGRLTGGNLAVTNCLNLGKLVGTTVGAITTYPTATITSSYYLENTVNGTNDATGLDRTPSELQRKSTFVGWDFDTTPTWNLNVSETGFNVPMLEVFKNLNLKQPEYYTSVYNAWFNYSRNTYNQTSIVTLTNPTAESIFNGGFGNRIIPANTLRVGDKYLIKVKGTYTATATPTNTLTLQLGGVTLAESIASIGNATDETFQWDMTLTVNDIGATGEIVGCGIAIGTTGGSAQNSLVGRQIPKVSPAPVIDTTADNAIEILYTSASTTLNVECILIERVRVK